MAKRLSRRNPGSRRGQMRRRALSRELTEARSSLKTLGVSRAGLAQTIQAYESRSQDTARQLNNLVNSSAIAMVRTTLEGFIESWNVATEDLFGYLAAEVRGRPITILAPASEGEPLSQLLEKARNGQSMLGLDVSLLGKNGLPVRAALSVSPTRNPQGKVAGVLFSARARSGGQDESADSALVESSNDAIVSQTLDGIITSWNKGAEWIYGYRAEEVLRQPISILAPQHKTDESFKILERIARGERVGHYETTRMRKDGKPIVVSVTTSPIIDSQGRIIGASAISRDITERKQAEEALLARTQQLARVNAELELFTSAAAHDLQEPLRKILLMASRLKATASRLEPSALEDVKRIEGSALHMRRLASGLVEYSAASTKELRFQEVDLTATVHAIASEFQPQLKAAHARLVIGKLAKVWGDGAQIRLLLRHLLDNALKFRRPKVSPVVRISSRVHRDGWAELVVANNGLGVEPRFRERIFEPFKRLHGHEAFEGAGLGLAISRRIIWRHDGKIEVNDAPGRGTALRVWFPPHRG